MSSRADSGQGTPRRRRVAKAAQLTIALVGSLSVPLASFDWRFSVVSCICLALLFILDPVANPDAEPWWRGRSKWEGSLDLASGAEPLAAGIRKAQRSLGVQFDRAWDRLRRPRRGDS